MKVTGNFPKDAYTVKQVRTEEGIAYTVEIHNLDLEIDYPEGITNENLIEVKMVTDAGIHEKQAIKQALKNSEETDFFDVNISPNPTSDFITIFFDQFSNSEKNVDISIFDINGKKIATVFSGILSESKNQLRLDISSLNIKTGTYFIFFNSNSQSHLDKFIYTK